MKTPIETLSERLNKVSEALNVMKSAGISEDLLIAWLVVELRLSKKQAKAIINAVESFYSKLIVKESEKRI